jgi:hypothetical protein
MEHNMKETAKQLATAALVLASVTALSLGIRRVRFSMRRAKAMENPVAVDTGQSNLSAGASDREGDRRSERTPHGSPNPARQPGDTDTFGLEADRHSDTEAMAYDHIESQAGSSAHSNSVSTTKAFKGEYAEFNKGKYAEFKKGDYAKSKGSKGLTKISIGAYEDIYVTEEGDHWYVSKQPDGSIAKMKLETENVNGEVTVVGEGQMNVYPAGGGKSGKD